MMKSILLSILLLCLGVQGIAQDTELDLSKPLEPILKSIYFGGGSAYIDVEQVQDIHELVKSIPKLDMYQISITSHTDNIGGREYNQWLSQKRSEAVLDELIRANVPKNQVFIKDFGQDNPHYSNATNAGRMRNRRVDILFSPINM